MGLTSATMGLLFKTTKESVEDLNLPKVEPKVVEPKIPPKPILYGDKFRIQICTDSNKASGMANALHNISRFGITNINASDDIEEFLNYYFTKMSRRSSTEALERLADDYNCQPGIGHPEYFALNFELNKQQTIEFMELVERASQGVSI